MKEELSYISVIDFKPIDSEPDFVDQLRDLLVPIWVSVDLNEVQIDARKSFCMRLGSWLLDSIRSQMN